MANQKPRVSRHNGRAGKHGVYNPKHNDRQFDVAHAENIHQDRTRLNLYCGISTSSATAIIWPGRQPAM